MSRPSLAECGIHLRYILNAFPAHDTVLRVRTFPAVFQYDFLKMRRCVCRVGR